MCLHHQAVGRSHDPVHPTPATYKVLASKIVDMADDMLSEQPAAAAVSGTPPPTKRAASREPWIMISEPVDKRLIPSQTTGASHSRGGQNGSGGEAVDEVGAAVGKEEATIAVATVIGAARTAVPAAAISPQSGYPVFRDNRTRRNQSRVGMFMGRGAQGQWKKLHLIIKEI
jgi:hypothetical protein